MSAAADLRPVVLRFTVPLATRTGRQLESWHTEEPVEVGELPATVHVQLRPTIGRYAYALPEFDLQIEEQDLQRGHLDVRLPTLMIRPRIVSEETRPEGETILREAY
jgi:hypothetical protein